MTSTDPSRLGDEYAAAVSADDAFEVLSNQRRRYIVKELHAADDQTELGPLAERVAARENDIAVLDVTHAQRKRVYTALQQSHLPKMDDLNVVHFDKDRGIVEPRDTLSDLRMYMHNENDAPNDCLKHYFLLSTLGVLLLAGYRMGVWPMTTLPGMTVAMAFLSSCSICVFFHWCYNNYALPENDDGFAPLDQIR
jgi:hypothetical protein